jgi:hypothetical protein
MSAPANVTNSAKNVTQRQRFVTPHIGIVIFVELYSKIVMLMAEKTVNITITMYQAVVIPMQTTVAMKMMSATPEPIRLSVSAQPVATHLARIAVVCRARALARPPGVAWSTLAIAPLTVLAYYMELSTQPMRAKSAILRWTRTAGATRVR